MQPVVSLVFTIIFLSLIFIGIRKIGAKKVQRVRALGLEGTGQIKKIVELELEREGNTLKDGLAGNEFPIATGPVFIQPLKGKMKLGYLVDLEKGCTVSLQKGGSVTDLKTDPQLISTILDSDILKTAFALRPAKAQIFITFLVALAMGYIIGKL